MQASQNELNDFVLDLIELMGKHFTARFDKTRVAGGNLGVSIRIRRVESGSELEIATDNLDPCIDFGAAQLRYRELRGDKDALFDRILADLTGIFLDRIVAVEGFAGETSLGGLLFRGLADEAAREEYLLTIPAAQRLILKRWTLPAAVTEAE